jgi:hypothetical protein
VHRISCAWCAKGGGENEKFSGSSGSEALGGQSIITSVRQPRLAKSIGGCQSWLFRRSMEVKARSKPTGAVAVAPTFAHVEQPRFSCMLLSSSF